MIKVRLLTSDGKYVTSGNIPPFVHTKEPSVIHWGTRTFSYAGFCEEKEQNILLYKESFAYSLVENFFEELS